MHAWDKESVFHDGDRFFSALCDAIDGARMSVSLETYIFDRDRLGERVLSHLVKAAERGVRVRLMLDGFGCSQWTHADTISLEERGVRVRFFNPLPWQVEGNRWWRFRLRLARLNRRNHRKTCVVDGTRAFLGGMNVSERHSTDTVGSEAWRDTSVEVAGRNVRLLTHAFDNAWSHPKSLRRRWRRYRRLPAPSDALRLNITRAQRRAGHHDLVRRLLGARRRVWITNPYFVPDLALLRALRFAAWSGADVRLLFPEKNDVLGMRWAARAFYSALLKAGVAIHEYKPSVLHAKIVLVDDWVRVGSSNLNSRSLLHDLEADAVLFEKSSLESVENRFLSDLRHSAVIEAGAWRRRSWLSRRLERFVLLFRKWL